MSDAQLNEIISDFTNGRIKHIRWKEQTFFERKKELTLVMQSAHYALRESGMYMPVVPRNDAGRIVFGGNSVQIPVFAFVHSALVKGGLRYDYLAKPNNVFARVKAALWYERNVRDELLDSRAMIVQAASLGGLVGSMLGRSIPCMVVSSALCVGASMALPILTERNAMTRLAVNSEFHRDIASYLYNASVYEAKRGHYWQAFKASCAHSAFMRLPVDGNFVPVEPTDDRQ